MKLSPNLGTPEMQAKYEQLLKQLGKWFVASQP